MNAEDRNQYHKIFHKSCKSSIVGYDHPWFGLQSPSCQNYRHHSRNISVWIINSNWTASTFQASKFLSLILALFFAQWFWCEFSDFVMIFGLAVNFQIFTKTKLSKNKDDITLILFKRAAIDPFWLKQLNLVADSQTEHVLLLFL